MERTDSVFLYRTKSVFLVKKYVQKRIYARNRKNWKFVPIKPRGR